MAEPLRMVSGYLGLIRESYADQLDADFENSFNSLSTASSVCTRAVQSASLPSGCSITSAKLRIYNGSPVSGRTLEALRTRPHGPRTA